jgi:hypothetical protein
MRLRAALLSLLVASIASGVAVSGSHSEPTPATAQRNSASNISAVLSITPHSRHHHVIEGLRWASGH